MEDYKRSHTSQEDAREATEDALEKTTASHLVTDTMDVELQDLPLGPLDDGLQDTLHEDLVYDKTCRRSSLGADSLLDQDFTDDAAPLEGDAAGGGSVFTSLDTVLGYQYADDIYAIKKAMEEHYHPYNCMADQPQVTEYMRCTLVHWLIKVNHQLQFGPETVFLAVNLADRFLVVTPLAQDCLQLLAVAALFVAAKMEECVVPGITELVSMCAGTYRPHHFRRMEVLILSKLGYALHSPTCWYFIDHLTFKATQMCGLDRNVVTVARHVAETCLSNYEISQFLPSVQASAAMQVALSLVPVPSLQANTWQTLLYTLYTEAEKGDARICSSLMTRYMTPFLEAITSDLGPGHETPPSTLPFSPPDDRMEGRDKMDAHATEWKGEIKWTPTIEWALATR
ncbi:G2/mitotic-specific cyclin S13-7-like [Penaeus monodon]|uniref:G2/mitotic-specific cyclin S13-7-like n=1 Tax=Penaeus monodon TaxID=6687 RepID=UPI0018A79DA5|nr:G2/mitotic-specific cyclin S13-7-like [Penaeus monodon]